MEQCIDHRAVIGTVASRLNHYVARKAEMVAEREQRVFARIAWCIFALRRVGKIITGAEHMAVRIDGARRQSEVGRFWAGMKRQPVGIHIERAHYRPRAFNCASKRGNTRRALPSKIMWRSLSLISSAST